MHKTILIFFTLIFSSCGYSLDIYKKLDKVRPNIVYLNPEVEILDCENTRYDTWFSGLKQSIYKETASQLILAGYNLVEKEEKDIKSISIVLNFCYYTGVEPTEDERIKHQKNFIYSRFSMLSGFLIPVFVDFNQYLSIKITNADKEAIRTVPVKIGVLYSFFYLPFVFYEVSESRERERYRASIANVLRDF